MDGPREMSGEDLSLSERIVQRIADVEGVPPTALTPLYEVVDPDSLDRLFSPTISGDRDQGKVVFSYNGHVVSIGGDGRIDLDDPDATAAGGTGG